MPELISTFIILMLFMIVGFLLHKLSKTKLKIQEPTLVQLTQPTRLHEKKDSQSTIYSVDNIQKLPDKILLFKLQGMLSNVCIQNFNTTHIRLNGQDNSRLVHIVFLDEATALMKTANNQFMDLLEKYTIENTKEKMN